MLGELVSLGACRAGTLAIVLSCCALLPMPISQKYCMMQLILFPSFRCVSVVMFKGYHLLLCQGCATVGCSSHWEAGWGSRNYRGSSGDHSDGRCYPWNPGLYACSELCLISLIRLLKAVLYLKQQASLFLLCVRLLNAGVYLKQQANLFFAMLMY